MRRRRGITVLKCPKLGWYVEYSLAFLSNSLLAKPIFRVTFCTHKLRVLHGRVGNARGLDPGVSLTRRLLLPLRGLPRPGPRAHAVTVLLFLVLSPP